MHHTTVDMENLSCISGRQLLGYSTVLSGSMILYTSVLGVEYPAWVTIGAGAMLICALITLLIVLRRRVQTTDSGNVDNHMDQTTAKALFYRVSMLSVVLVIMGVVDFSCSSMDNLSVLDSLSHRCNVVWLSGISIAALFAVLIPVETCAYLSDMNKTE